MLKLRVMPTLLYKSPTLVKGVGFDSWRRVGSLMQAIKVYNLREVDELVFLDITATKENRKPDYDLVDDFADECFMPLTVGGGVRTLEDFRKLLQVGADKIAINTIAVEDSNLVTTAAEKFGSQCVVVSLDIKKNEMGSYKVFTHSGTKPTELDPVEFAIDMERRGAGEILLTSIDNDGTMKGYEIEIIKKVCEAVNIPVIASGGAGNLQHCLDVIRECNVSAIAAASIFHFTEITPLDVKKYLSENGIATRL